MTSATGEAPRPCRDTGFTLVEVLVVMAILVLLFSLVAVGVERVRTPGARASTKALLQRLESYLDDYRRRTGHYPPDGLDYRVASDDGQPLRGAACLYYFLAQTSVVSREIRAGRETIREREPPIARFSERELTPEDPSTPGVREILDAWGTPLHYDNTEDGKFEPQRGDVHLSPLKDEEHPADPRTGEVEVDGTRAVAVPGIQCRGYDLWSHGSQGHEMDEASSLPVASWNLR